LSLSVHGIGAPDIKTNTPLTHERGPARDRAAPNGHAPRHRGRSLRNWLRAKDWDDHVADIEQVCHSAGFVALREQLLELAALRPHETVLDLGAGTGLLSLAAARQARRVYALDVSDAMCRHLDGKFVALDLRNAHVVHSSAARVPLADDSVDAVVSNYCFHHLHDDDKASALAEAMRVLRPGGRLVFADMMFRVGIARPRDRAVIGRFVLSMLKHGPAGVLRLFKNVTRVLLGRGERPATVAWWRDALLAAGFVDVCVQALDHEGGVAVAHKPSPRA
jgi:ubiquinone/menaquinone biosynthesis C-methylase UbiE